MKYPQLPTFAFLAAFLVLIPLPVHWRARNVATLAHIFWLFVANIIYAINSIVWSGNTNDTIPVWCDITTKLTMATSYALPLCTLCICKHLELVSSCRTVTYSFQDKRRRMIFEGCMCLFAPLVFICLHHIVQGHRYDIIEAIGCQAAVYISLPAVFIIWFPQLSFSSIASIYGAMALRNFLRHRLVLAAHLHNSNSSLTTNRYLRLIAMALTEMCWGTVLTAFNLSNNVKTGLRPWTSWDDVHSNFGRVGRFSTSFLPSRLLRTMFLFWWTIPVSSFIFFIFFGFGEEAMKEYRRIGSLLQDRLWRRNRYERKRGYSSKSSEGLRTFKLPSLHKHTLASSKVSTSHFQSKLPSNQAPRSFHSTTSSKNYTNDYPNRAVDPPSSPPFPPLPSYAAVVGHPIDLRRDDHRFSQPRHDRLPLIDDSDAFSTTSFTDFQPSLGMPTSYVSPSSHTRHTSSTTPTSSKSFGKWTFVPPTPPQPPSSPRLPGVQHSLPPPPRIHKQPRTISSLTSLISTAASFVTTPRPTFTSNRPPTRKADVPEDVCSFSYSQSLGDDILLGHPPLSTTEAGWIPGGDGRRILGVEGGGIMVTVQRQASVDQLV